MYRNNIVEFGHIFFNITYHILEVPTLDQIIYKVAT